jgi:hypothetical protein
MARQAPGITAGGVLSPNKEHAPPGRGGGGVEDLVFFFRLLSLAAGFSFLDF